MSNSKTSLEDRMSFIEEALTLLLKKETAGVVASAAAPQAKVAPKTDQVFPDPTWSIYEGGHRPLISVQNIGIGPNNRPGVSGGLWLIRTVDYFVNNPKEWMKAKAAHAKADKK